MSQSVLVVTAGAAAFLAKPFRTSTLLALVQSALE